MHRDHRPDSRLAWVFALALGVFAVFCRVAPYLLAGPKDPLLWNLMPIGGLALFAGSRLRSPLALLVPLGAMLAADLLLVAPLAARGWPAFTWNTPLVYASFAVYFGIGWLIRTGSFNPAWIVLAAIAASVQFFLVTNFGTWAMPFDARYARDLSGLLHSYRDGLPFYTKTLVGDMAFTLVFFAAFHALAGPRRERVPA